MDDGPGMASKAERFAEFLRRLGAAPAASDADGAYRLLCETLDGVEDEFSGVANIPANWMTDERMYPPQADNIKAVPGRPGVRRYRTKAHNVLIGENGAIEIREATGRTVLNKPGSDGRPL